MTFEMMFEKVIQLDRLVTDFTAEISGNHRESKRRYFAGVSPVEQNEHKNRNLHD